MAGNWRGTVGCVKPGTGGGSTEELIRLLPDGIGIIATAAGIREYNEQGFHDALESYRQRMGELADLGICDLLHPEGAPPFMVRGRAAEQEIVKEWEQRYKVPVFTSGMTQVEALRALGIERLVGASFFGGPLPDIFARYLTDAGFDVAGMEALPPRPREFPNVSAEDIYIYLKRAFFKYQGVQGSYLLGSAGWTVKGLVPLEEDLGVPVLHPIAVRSWYIQKRLNVRQPLQGMGRLLETMP